jgi:diguanylate cyclase (GGDEF)-like protein/PAS domain S-box-containing protein
MEPAAPIRVLIVEDESVVAMDLADQLEDMGYQICGIADTGAEAIELAAQHAPQVVMMDIVIKGELDGIDTAERIRRRFQVPVIFATAYSDPETVARAARTAPYGYITKPYQARDVHAAIEVALFKYSLEARLRESELWFSSTLRCVADGVVATDLKGRIRFMNPAAEQMLGTRLETAQGQDIQEVIAFDDTGEKNSTISQILREGMDEAVIDFGRQMHTGKGERLLVDASAALIRDGEVEPLGAVVALRDVSERIEAEEALRNSEERFRTAFDFAPIGMALVSLTGRFLQGNVALCALLGCTPEELLTINQRAVTLEEDRPLEETHLRELLVNELPYVHFEKRYRSLSGRLITSIVSVALLRKGDVPVCYLYQVHDITERKLYENRIIQMAHFDTLTGLANRARLADEIERHIAMSRRSGVPFAIAFGDLDHFKHVNDTLGHEAGDHLLKTIARRLKGAVREVDVVARLGGDEFVLLLDQIHDPEDAVTVVNKAIAAISSEVVLDGVPVHVGSSFGLSLYPSDGDDARTLLRNADSALYEAKARGRGRVEFYRAELTEQVSKRLQLDTELRAAVREGQFVLHYQPIHALADGHLIGVEALVRWQHPVHGLLGPAEFISYAEETGLILDIGQWVLREACAARARWRAHYTGPLKISVNVSSVQFDDDRLIPSLEAALAASGLAPDDLILELTEQLLLEKTDRNLALIGQIKALGVQFAVDDFGVGYSSLSYIVRFAPHEIKIDRSFVQRIGTGQLNDTLLESIVTLSDKLGATVVAEGVETDHQRAFLEAAGCRAAQGFLLNRPMPEEALVQLLDRLQAGG